MTPISPSYEKLILLLRLVEDLITWGMHFNAFLDESLL